MMPQKMGMLVALGLQCHTSSWIVVYFNAGRVEGKLQVSRQPLARQMQLLQCCAVLQVLHTADLIVLQIQLLQACQAFQSLYPLYLIVLQLTADSLLYRPDK